MSARTSLWRFGNLVRRVRYFVVAKLIFAILALLQLLPARKAINASAALVQQIGPLFPRHKVVMDNLALAFPEKPLEERRQIAKAMWRNMGRMLAEYVFLDTIFDYDPDATEPGLIEVEGREIFQRLLDNGEKCIFFTGHTGNFELLPVCAATFGLEVTALFRPPNNPYLAERVLGARTTHMGHLVPSKAGAAWGLAKALDEGRSIGVLVDQKFLRGVQTTFFGHPVLTNPLLPKFVRQFDVPVHPARCVRLPGGRYRLELKEAIELPRTENGEIDVAASCQMLNDIVEGWVREYPDQWMWMHRRWQLAKHNRKQS